MRFLPCLFIFLTACTLHPRYGRPPMITPCEWRVETPVAETMECRFWEQFGDPVLDNLIQTALAYNQDLRVAVANVQNYWAQITAAASLMYPQISGNYNAERMKQSTEATPFLFFSDPTFNQYQLFFNISYLIDLWGEIRSGTEVAVQNYLEQVEARRSLVITIVSSVASNYIFLRSYDEQLEISKRTLVDRQKELEIEKTRFALGYSSEMEVEMATTAVQDAIVAIENLEISIAQTENLISALIGFPSQDIPRGKTLEELCMPACVPTYLPSDLINQRPDILQAEHALISANAQIGVSMAQLFPSFNLIGQWGGESIRMHNLLTYPAQLWDYGMQVAQEIFTGGRLISNVRSDQALMREAIHQYLSTVLTAFKEVNDALISFKLYKEMVETQAINVEALKKYLYLSNLRYKDGKSDYLTFLNAETSLFNGELSLVQARANSFNSLIQIYQSLGGGWAIDADTILMQHVAETCY